MKKVIQLVGLTFAVITLHAQEITNEKTSKSLDPEKKIDLLISKPFSLGCNFNNYFYDGIADIYVGYRFLNSYRVKIGLGISTSLFVTNQNFLSLTGYTSSQSQVQHNVHGKFKTIIVNPKVAFTLPLYERWTLSSAVGVSLQKYFYPYEDNSLAESMAKNEQLNIGPSLEGGIQFQINDKLFAQSNYTYIHYVSPMYRVFRGTGNKSFTNSSVQNINVGLGIRF